MSILLSALDVVDSHLDQVCELALSKGSKSRKIIVQEFQNAETVVEAQINVLTKIPKKPRNVKRNLIGLRNLCKSIHEGVSDQEITPSDLKDIIRTHVQPLRIELSEATKSARQKAEQQSRIDSAVEGKIQDLWSSAIDKVATDEIPDNESVLGTARKMLAAGETTRIEMENEVDRDKQMVKRCRTQLTSYKKYESRLATKKSPEFAHMQKGQFIPVECPIFVSFASVHLREPHTLESIGFNPTSVSSLESGYPDVALILEDQVLLQFSKSAAREKLIGGYQQQRKSITSSDTSKIMRKKKAELKAAVKDFEEMQARSESNNSRTIAKLVSSKLPELEQKVTALESDVKHLEQKLKRERHAITVAQRETVTKSAIKNEEGRAKILLKPKALEYHVNSILQEFAKHGKHYGLLSKEFVPHPTIADVYLAWLVPSEQVKFCHKIYSDQNLVASWGFPWQVHV